MSFISKYFRVKLSRYTNKDSDENVLLIAHAYKAQTAGVAYGSVNLNTGNACSLYVGLTNDPLGAGERIEQFDTGSTTFPVSLSAHVAKGEYFEFICPQTVTIKWKSFWELKKPIDYN